MSYALITGASKGIGKHIAINLAKKKIPLLLIARSENELQDLCSDLNGLYGVPVHYLAIDLSTSHAAESVFNWCIENNFVVNILINNAGYGLSGLQKSFSIQEINAMMQVNMSALVSLTQIFLPTLQEQKSAYILNIASNAAYQAVPGLSLYAATKAFVLSFSRGLHYELRNTNVSVTVVCPGPTDTNFSNRAKIGGKALKAAEKVNMSAEAVAKIAVNAMFAKNTEVIAGFINKLGAFLVWLLPKKLAEKVAADIYDI